MLRLKTLGGLSVQGDAGPVTGAAAQRRRLALPALLARAGDRGLSRDKILGYLWPDSEPDKARNVLAQALYALRRDLGSDQLFLGTIDLRLNPQVITSDVAAFSAALAGGRREEAVALYAGPFLDGFYVSDAPEFERWVENERVGLAHDYAAALERLAADAGAAGDHLGAVGWWRKLAAADPLSGRVAAGLMEALARAGDRAGALQHARVHEALVRQELEVEPDPEVRALAERLRREPAVAPAAAPAPATAPSAGSAASPRPEYVTPIAEPHSAPAERATFARRGLWLGAVGLLLLAAVVFAPRFWRSDADTRRMLAVLPFQNLGTADDEYFADGLTEEITTRLARIGGLGVISRTSSMQYKGTRKSLREIGRELGVDYVLEGSVRWTRSPDGRGRVRVTPQLIRVKDDSHLWADRYDADLADIFQVQGHIAEEVAGALHVTLNAPERRALSAPLTQSVEAYDAYIQAGAFLDRGWGDEKRLASAVEAYERAVSLDTAFASAFARLSVAHTMMYRLGYDATEERLGRAKAALDDAFRLDSTLADAHVALGYYHYWGRRAYAEAEAEFRRALERRPNDPDVAFGIGVVARRQGKWPEAVQYLKRAAELDPRSSNKAWDCGLAHFFVRDYREAELYLDRAVALGPEWGFGYATKARLYLSWTGDTARARRVVREAVGRVRLADLATGTNDAAFLMAGDSALTRSLAGVDVEQFGDSLLYYMWRALWHRHQERPEASRAAWDSMRVHAEAYVERRRRIEQTHPADAEQAHVFLAIAYGGLGRKADALAEIQRATELLPPDRDAAWGADRSHWFAQIYVWLGEHARALAELERLLAVPSPLSTARLQVDPVWAPLRADPRFKRLLDS